jgi:hypothetical protein
LCIAYTLHFFGKKTATTISIVNNQTQYCQHTVSYAKI